MDGDQRVFLNQHRAHDVGDLLERWRVVAESAALKVATLGEAGGHPVLVLEGKTGGGGVYLSAGIHGDEPAGSLGLVEWAEKNVALLREVPVMIVPCLNPWGLEQNVRTNERGVDLNRSFDRSGEGPIAGLMERISSRRFRRAVMLHEDYDAQGVYLYELGAGENQIGEQLLGAVEGIIPRQVGEVDGRPSEGGVVRRAGNWEQIVEEIDGMPEAIYLASQGAEISLTFETPSEYSLYDRVRTQAAFVDAVFKGL